MSVFCSVAQCTLQRGFLEVHMAMSDARYKLFGGGQYPSECDEDAPVPPTLPVPFCRCEPGNQLAEVKQSRHPKTAGRAFYICKWNDSLNPCHCFFFQWIDGPDKFDPRIRLFPYYRSESWAYNEFRRWVPPPPNPPPMTEEEKQEAAIYRVNNPPKCHCSVRAKLQRPNIAVPPKFTPFFRCSLKTREGRTGDWEWFEGRYELMLQLGRTKEPWKSRETLNRKLNIRKDYQVTLPLESFLSGPVLQDLRRDYGKKAAEKTTLEDCIVYWRRNRSKYPRPLTDRELLANYEKKEKEEEMERQMLREERAKKGFTVDPEAKYPKGSWEEYFQKLDANKRMEEMEKMGDLAQEAQMEAMQTLVADLPHKVPNVEKDVSSASTEVLGVGATQMEAMKALVGDLPAQDHPSDRKEKTVGTRVVDNHVPDDGDDDEWWSMNADEVEVIVSQIEVRKGKAVVQDDDDDDGWGELLIEGDSD
ncbi:hypothetical protein PVAP13_5KG590707 [Panicum virgatum]|uniref:GRF-type domain-containing protein n=1 Tax=Panicum virgatum TaxID=38727 RepID=A0A8T0SVX7_PANVG|nr:hypothetical protein PVAP13_5KG590707 [Panicum virgatum]